MRRRLDLAASLIVKPKVLFLDEPTTGLDPRGRQDMWVVIEELVQGGVTLLLTTQYLEEADQLADEIAVIDHGKVIARGTSDQLKTQVGGERLEVTVDSINLSAATSVLKQISGNEPLVDAQLRKVSVAASGGSSVLTEIVRALDSANVQILDLALKRPSLDDVFMSLTGHVAEEENLETATKKGRGRK
jgi:ABC-2 type transport system ATP-binding protein